MTGARARWAILAILVVALGLRLPGGAWPPGLYRDEAWYGLDAAATLDDGPSLWYPANNGREPLFPWLAAGFVAVLGRTPAAVRLPVALAGVVMVAGVYAWTARLAGRRAAFAAAALAAVVPWPVFAARTGFRAGLLPALLVVAAAATARAAATGRTRHALVAGALGGLAPYAYTAARLAPLVPLAAWAAWRPRAPGRRRAVTAAWLASAALASLPLVAALVATPGALTGRAGQVALWRAADGDALGAVVASARDVAGMVAVRGDANPRHDAVAGWPVFRPPAAALWAVGALVVVLGVVGRGRLGRAGAVALVAWGVALGLPTVLAEDAPHFLRGIGLMPALLVVAGLGAGALVDAARRVGGRRRRAWVRAATASVALAVLVEAAAIFVAAGWDREGRYLVFEGGAADLALAVNRSLGAGWRGGWSAGDEAPGRPVWLDRRLRDGWASVPYLVPIERLTLTDPYDPVLRDPGGVAFLVPYGLDLERVWAERPQALGLRLTPGALERGDLAPAPTRMWVALERLDEGAPTGPPLAVFANGMVLESARLAPPGALDPAGPTGAPRVLELAWRLGGPPPAGEPRVHVVAQAPRDAASGSMVLLDGPLGGGVYPSWLWRVGDRLVERVPHPALDRALGSIALYVKEAGAERSTEARDGRGVPLPGGRVDVLP